jgi:hypothetical protein
LHVDCLQLASPALAGHAGRVEGGCDPPGTGVQWPLDPGRLHASQGEVGLQPPSQHTPSTQKPVAHVEALEQAAPYPDLQAPAPSQRPVHVESLASAGRG